MNDIVILNKNNTQKTRHNHDIFKCNLSDDNVTHASCLVTMQNGSLKL